MKAKSLQTETVFSELQDRYSYSEPYQVRIKHLDLDLDVLFDSHILRGTATLSLEELFSGELVLDTLDLGIERVEYSADLREFHEASFEVGKSEPVKGAPLIIRLPKDALAVRIRYSTGENASGLQWLEPAQTAGKKHPFLFTQSEATHARSWIPLQDTPKVRMTFDACVHKPRTLRALMSAVNNPEAAQSHTRFTMPYPIPAYLMALAVGDLQEVSGRTGVFAEKATIGAAARELEDLEQMLRAAEELFGTYRWERYDVLVLPPSFPVGGMENPCLTFVTPTIIAGDKSLTSLIAHEIAHSWSSNLVSNATWEHFWINEGFTVYMERRILERLYGRRRAEMEAVLGTQDLAEEFARLDPTDQVLAQVNQQDPNIGYSQVPYEKGALFLRTIEEAVGRPRFDTFLKGYFEHFAFQSITTLQFVEYLERNLLNEYPGISATLAVNEWLHGPGLPAGASLPTSDVLEKVEKQAAGWLRDEVSLRDVHTSGWSTREWLRFLKYIENRVDVSKMQALDREFDLTQSGNAEIQSEWLLMAIRNRYTPAYKRVEQFLTQVGRRKYLKSLYGELAKTPEGKQWAHAIYKRARPNYHPIARDSVSSILG